MKIGWLLIFIPFFSQAQDSLSFRAKVSNYIPVPAYGLTSNGHIYTTGFKLHYTGGVAQPMEVIRVDITSRTTSAKTLPYTLSSTSFYWRHVHHTTGDYFGLNSGNRKVVLLNMRDSIYDYNFGNCFVSGDNLAYGMSTGRDGNIYLSGSSSATQNTAHSFINVATKEVAMFAKVDNQDYALSINGDTNWIYIQTGQDGYNYWAVNKETGAKKLLYANQPSIFNQGATNTGIYVQAPGQVFKRVTDTTLTTALFTGTSTEFADVTGITTHFNDVSSRFSWQLSNGDTSSMEVPNSWEDNNIRRIYPDRYNDSLIHYAADYYGPWHTYNRFTNVTTTHGHIGFNLFDAKQVDSLHWIFVGYPSSWVAVWNRGAAWTAETFMHPLSNTTNPQSKGTGRATSDVHEPTEILPLGGGKFMFGGNEIRTGKSVGINVYNYNTGALTGFKALLDNQYYGSIAMCGTRIVLATDSGGVKGKLYFLNSTPAIIDSINTGFRNNGTIFCLGERLYGIAQDTANDTQSIDSAIFYVYNLVTKELIYYKKMRGLASAVQYMPDGYIGINFKLRTGPGAGLSDAPLPKDFPIAMRRIDNRKYRYASPGKYYSVNGIYPLQYNVGGAEIDHESASGKYQIINLKVN